LIFGKGADHHPILRRAIDSTITAKGEVLEVTHEILEKISRKENPQTVLAVFEQAFTPLEDIDPKSNPVWIALEQVRHPGNLGTIIRTDDAARIGGVILIGDCVDPYSVECVRATMGSIFDLPIVKCSLETFIAQKSRWTGSIVAAHLKATQTHRDCDYRAPCLILMGTEQSGLSDTLTALADTPVKIPMRGRADSLNLSIASAIMIYAATETLL
jgi:TrmH family RNA methyltransferase